MKYIDVEKLKELIDEKWKELADKNVKVGGGKWDAEISTYLSVLRFINSLQQEQPEVDLKMVVRIDNIVMTLLGEGYNSGYKTRPFYEEVLRRLNAKKEE